MQKTADRKDERDDRGRDAGPQEPRRIRSKTEVPPEVRRVRYVAVREKPEPHRRRDDEEDRHEPARRERLVDEPGAPVEMRAARKQRGECHEQDRRFFVVESFEDRERRAGEQQPERHDVRRVDPPLQSPREKQQIDSRDARQEMGCLDDRQRHGETQDLNAMALGRSGPRRQQHDAGEEDRDRENLRHEHRQHARRPSTDASEDLPIAHHLVADDQQRGHAERHEVVDDAERDQRGEQTDRRDHTGEQRQHRGVEYADTRGQIARHTHDLREQRSRGDGSEREKSSALREQQIERRRHQQPVARRDRDLRKRDLQLRQRKRPLADAHGLDRPRRRESQIRERNPEGTALRAESSTPARTAARPRRGSDIRSARCRRA